MSTRPTTFDELLGQSRWLARLARSLVADAALADDLVQEVWLAALARPPQAGRERAWMRTVLRRRRADAHRRAAAEELATDRLAAPSPAPDEATETLEAHARLGEALRRLPDAYREVVVARYFHGEEPRDIAARLDRPASTVRAQISRGLDLLRTDLDRQHGGDRRRWALGLVPLAARDALAAGSTAGAGVLATSSILGAIMTSKTLVLGGVATAALLVWFLGARRGNEDDLAPRRDADAEAVSAAEAPRRGAAGPAPTPGETAAATASLVESPTAPLVLSLRDSGGAPLASARVLLHRDEDLLADLRADVEGRVRRAGASGRASCVVVVPGRALFSREVPLGGEVEVVVPRGAVVGGHVTVAGGLPYREVPLELLPDRPFEPELPAAIRAFVRPDPADSAVLRTVATPDGRFAFTGLPQDFRGSLRLGPGFGFAERESYFHRSLTIEAPRDDLELALIALPLVRGRLVQGRDGAPIPFHDVRVVFAAAATGAGTSLGERSDEDGRFAITVTEPDFDDLRLLVPHGGAVIERRSPAVFRDTHDFGDVVLGETETWRFRVVDTAGAPIVGALIASGETVRTRPTDGEGRGHLDDVGPELRAVLAGAPGFRSRSCEVRLGEEQTITLERANRLVVRLRGLPVGILRPEVAISGPAGLLERGFAETIAFETTALSSISREGPDGAVQLTARPRADGSFVFEGLAPEVAFRVEARDLAGQLLASRDEVRLADTEHLDLDLAFDAANLRVTRLTVLDPQGRPVPAAEIVRRGAEDDVPLFVDDAGRAVLVRPRGPGPDLLVSAEGHRPVELADGEVPEGARDVILHPAEDG